MEQTGALSKPGRPPTNRRVPSGVPAPPSPAQRCPSAICPHSKPWSLACPEDTVSRVASFYCFILCGLCHKGFTRNSLFAIRRERPGCISVPFTWAHNCWEEIFLRRCEHVAHSLESVQESHFAYFCMVLDRLFKALLSCCSLQWFTSSFKINLSTQATQQIRFLPTITTSRSLPPAALTLWSEKWISFKTRDVTSRGPKFVHSHGPHSGVWHVFKPAYLSNPPRGGMQLLAEECRIHFDFPKGPFQTFLDQI